MNQSKRNGVSLIHAILIFMKRWYLCLLFSSLSAHAEIYKWTNEKGEIVYGDRPPEQYDQVQTIRQNHQRTSQYEHQDLRSRKQRLNKFLDVMDEDREDKKRQQQERIANKKKLKANCQRLRAELQNMQDAQFLYRKDHSDILSDEERAGEEYKLKTKIAKGCKS